MSEQVKLMNLCMVTDAHGRVLVQNRRKNDWDGLTFPGGKVEQGEALTASVIREVREETGLTIIEPRLCGCTSWYDAEARRNIVFLYRTDQFSGTLRDSQEGHMEWMDREQLLKGQFAFGMDEMLHVFLEENKTEMWYQNSPKSWEITLM